MILIYEGPDGAGKTLLMQEVHAATKFAHVAVDRMHLSHLVYSQYYSRDLFVAPAELAKFVTSFKKFMVEQRPLIVYVKADPSVLDERMRRRGEDPKAGPASESAIKLYDHWLETLGFTERVITIDTTFDPPMDEVVGRIVGKVKSLERRAKCAA